MRNLKFILGILGLLLSFVTMGEDNYLYKDGGKSDLSGGTYTARISAKKATVYADENMLSPIGYIANGKAIKVGTPRRINRDLVPLIVYGRLAFIEIKDIQYENSSDDEYKFKKGAPLEHNFDLVLEKTDDRLSENNSLFLSVHAYTAGSDVKNVFLYYDGQEKSNFIGFQAAFVHRQATTNLFWGLNLDYSSISSDLVSFNYLMAGPSIGYTPIKNPVFALDIYGSLDFSVSGELAIENNDYNEPTGFIWGLQANARLLFYPDSRYHGFVGLGLRNYIVEDYETLRNASGEQSPGIKSIFGASASIGLAMDFR